jgi:hypothetical protein
VAAWLPLDGWVRGWGLGFYRARGVRGCWGGKDLWAAQGSTGCAACGILLKPVIGDAMGRLGRDRKKEARAGNQSVATIHIVCQRQKKFFSSPLPKPFPSGFVDVISRREDREDGVRDAKSQILFTTPILGHFRSPEILMGPLSHNISQNSCDDD